eukprot:sb/3477065/
MFGASVVLFDMFPVCRLSHRAFDSHTEPSAYASPNEAEWIDCVTTLFAPFSRRRDCIPQSHFSFFADALHITKIEHSSRVKRGDKEKERGKEREWIKKRRERGRVRGREGE